MGLESTTVGLGPRLAALEALSAVLVRGRPLDAALAGADGFERLPARDRAFARNLSATALRRLGELDALIAACLDRALPARAVTARIILRLGLCQIRHLRTPAHAAVSSSVSLAAQCAHGHKGLVNAVLRRLSREHEALGAGLDPARINTPDWLWESWAAAYGEDSARAIAEAHLREPPLDLSVVSEPEQLADRLGGTVLPTGSVRLRGAGPVAERGGFRDGGWWVQDAAAALPARLLGDVSGRRVADLCAAPGGKTLQLAAAGARVTAVDSDETRLVRLRENLTRLGLEAEIVAADARTWRPDEPFCAVLLDGPCFATGTIRRHPDAPHLRRPERIADLAVRQDALLAAAAEITAPGGTLVFSTCSLQPEEGPERVAAFLARAREWTRKPIAPDEIGGLAEAVTRDGDLRTLPCHLAALGGMDGFFAARLVRRRSRSE